jgi:hypothetical protein
VKCQQDFQNLSERKKSQKIRHGLLEPPLIPARLVVNGGSSHQMTDSIETKMVQGHLYGHSQQISDSMPARIESPNPLVDSIFPPMLRKFQSTPLSIQSF